MTEATKPTNEAQKGKGWEMEVMHHRIAQEEKRRRECKNEVSQ